MSRLRSFVLTTMLGGLAVFLPVLLFLALARWLAGLLQGLTAPLATALERHVGGGQSVAFIAALACLLLACFVTGMLVRTRVGAMVHGWVDGAFGRLAPGYRTVRDTVVQLLGAGSPGAPGALRGDVALVRVHGPRSCVAQVAIVTSRHADGSFSVFVPTAPLPTQGFVYHVGGECVQLLQGVSIEAAMRMVIACGAGAADLLPAEPLARAICASAAAGDPPPPVPDPARG